MMTTLFSNRPLALSLLCVFTALVLLNLKAIQWPFGIIDSPIILAQAIAYSPVEYFTDPHKYQFLSYNNFTPWVTLSWDLDYALFQLEPLGYRIHHLLSMIALLGAVFGVLYRLTGSLLTTTLFSFAVITLPASFAVADDLVNRHYLEGMIFCLVSFYCVQIYNQRQTLIWLALSVLLYVLSITAKEVFIPLPGILFFLFAGSFKRKVILTLPYAFVLTACLVWRFYMLSGTGGYSSAQATLDLIGNTDALFDLAQRLVYRLFATPAASLSMLASLALLLVLNFQQISLYTKLGILVGVFGLVLPLLALLPLMAVGFHSPRWLFAPSVALLLFYAYLCGVTKSRALVGGVYLIVFVSSVNASYLRIQEPTPAYAKGDGKVYKQILRSDPDSYLRLSNFSQMAAQGQAIWVYIAKLHNGVWGTLQVSDSGQLQYHDVTGRTAIKLGRKKFAAATSEVAQHTNLDLIESVEYNPDNGELTFNFSDDLHGDRCFVYIFGRDNGLLYRTTDCKTWRMPYRDLDYQLRMTGYEFTDLSVAVWPESPTGRIYSRPYPIGELVDLDVF